MRLADIILYLTRLRTDVIFSNINGKPTVKVGEKSDNVDLCSRLLNVTEAEMMYKILRDELAKSLIMEIADGSHRTLLLEYHDNLRSQEDKTEHLAGLVRLYEFFEYTKKEQK